jgi:hypothetical protein
LGVPESAITELASRFDGALYAPGDAGFADARAIWNGHVDLQPGLIAQCSRPADAVAVERQAGPFVNEVTKCDQAAAEQGVLQ